MTMQEKFQKKKIPSCSDFILKMDLDIISNVTPKIYNGQCLEK